MLQSESEFLISMGLSAQKGKVGTSVSLVGGTVTPENLAEIKAAGIEYLEVTMNPFVRKQPEKEVYIKAYKALKDINDAGLKVWSVHLPYSSSWDVSAIDREKRAKAVAFFEDMIALAGIFSPECLVLHPGADNIKDDEERAERLKCARNSIARLAIAAESIGACLCVFQNYKVQGEQLTGLFPVPAFTAGLAKKLRAFGAHL